MKDNMLRVILVTLILTIITTPIFSQSFIVTMNPDGSNKTQILNTAGVGGSKWSDDMSMIVFSAVDQIAPLSGRAEIFRANSDGSNILQLTDYGTQYGQREPKFNGSSKIWWIWTGGRGHSEIYEMNLDGSGKTPITNFYSQGKQALGIEFCDTKIFYDRQNNSSSSTKEICLANPSDVMGTEEQLTYNSQKDDMMDVSPDCNKLLMTRAEGSYGYNPPMNLFQLHLDGTGAEDKLTSESGNVFCGPAIYSPDGNQIVYSLQDGTQSDIWIMNVDGSDKHNITNTPGYNERSWDWQDGKILYTTNEEIVEDCTGETIFSDDFEVGPLEDKWFFDLHNNRGTKDYITDNPHSGNQSLFMKGSDHSPGGGSFMQTIPSFSTETAQITFWVRDASFVGSGGSAGHFDVYLNGPSGQNMFLKEQPGLEQGYFHVNMFGYIVSSSIKLSELTDWTKIDIFYESGINSHITVMVNDQTVIDAVPSYEFTPLDHVLTGVGGQYLNTGEIYLDDFAVCTDSKTPIDTCSKILFSNGTLAYPDSLHIMNSYGSDTSTFHTPPKSMFGRWSPDMTKIAFTSWGTPSGSSEIHIMNADGTGISQLTNYSYGSLGNAIPQFRTANKLWWYHAGPNSGRGELHEMNIDGTENRALSNFWSEGLAITYFDFNDATIVFSLNATNSHTTSELYVTEIGTDYLGRDSILWNNRTQLTSNSVYDSYPVISPDGTQILFVRQNTLGGADIHLINVDGTNEINITNEGSSIYNGFPIWSHDGSEIIYSRDNSGSNHVYKMNADGSNKVDITPSANPGGAIPWDWRNTCQTVDLPFAAFSADPVSGYAPLTVNFTDESTGDITSYLWDFGDGYTSTDVNPSHDYTTAGTFTVTLTVTGPGGDDSIEKLDFIQVLNDNEGPVVDPLEIEFSLVNNYPGIKFNGLVSDDNYGNSRIEKVEYFWDIDPGVGNGVNINADDGNWDSSNEPHEVVSIELRTLQNNNHTLFVRAMDSNNNWGVSSTQLITTYSTGYDIEEDGFNFYNWPNQVWGGNCLGMSSAAAYYFSSQNPILGNDIELQPNDPEYNHTCPLTTARPNRWHPTTLNISISQWWYSLFDAPLVKTKMLTKYSNGYSDALKYYFEDFEEKIIDGQNAIIYLRPPSYGGSGHVVLGYRTAIMENGKKAIFVYDPNYPNGCKQINENFEGAIRLSTDDNNIWSYQHHYGKSEYSQIGVSNLNSPKTIPSMYVGLCPADFEITTSLGDYITKDSVSSDEFLYSVTPLLEDVYDSTHKILYFGENYPQASYNIKVIPHDTANPESPISLLYYFQSNFISIAENILIKDLPPNGYLYSTLDTGSIAGFIANTGQGLLGVPVDIYDAGDTVIASAVSDENGWYQFAGLDNGVYGVSISSPLGYQAVKESQEITVKGLAHELNFELIELEITPQQRSRGYWAHQLHKALQNNSKDYTIEDFSGFCSLINTHFNNNEINPVDFYNVPQPADQSDSLRVLRKLLHMRNTIGYEPFLKRLANSQLMALLLNVVSGKVSQIHEISVDGCTISQAITYCDMLINEEIDPPDDGGPGCGSQWARYIRASFILLKCNMGLTVPEGMIPADVMQIAYRVRNEQEILPDEFVLYQNYPNPFNPVTEINFNLPSAAIVKLEIYNIMGQRVNTLLNGSLESGSHSVAWDSRDNNGISVSTGIYFYRLTTDKFVETKKMILLK